MRVCLSSHEVLLHVKEVIVEDLFFSPLNASFKVHILIELTFVAPDVRVSSQDLLSLHLPLDFGELGQVFEEPSVDE